MKTDPRASDPQKNKLCPLAIASMIIGLIGFVLCLVGPLFGLPAVILGHMSLHRIRNAGGARVGRSYALTGLVAGYVALTFGVLPAIFVYKNIHPGETRLRAQEARITCLFNMRTIEAAKDRYAVETSRTTGWMFENDQDAFDRLVRRGYLAGFPFCPASANAATGTVRSAMDYSVNPVGMNVECRIAPKEHRLPARPVRR